MPGDDGDRLRKARRRLALRRPRARAIGRLRIGWRSTPGEMDGHSRQGGQQGSAAVDQLRMSRRQTLASLDLQVRRLSSAAGRRSVSR